MNGLCAADPLSDGSIAAVEAIEKAITVDLIATFEPQRDERRDRLAPR